MRHQVAHDLWICRVITLKPLHETAEHTWLTKLLTKLRLHSRVPRSCVAVSGTASALPVRIKSTDWCLHDSHTIVVGHHCRPSQVRAHLLCGEVQRSVPSCQASEEFTKSHGALVAKPKVAFGVLPALNLHLQSTLHSRK